MKNKKNLAIIILSALLLILHMIAYNILRDFQTYLYLFYASVPLILAAILYAGIFVLIFKIKPKNMLQTAVMYAFVMTLPYIFGSLLNNGLFEAINNVLTSFAIQSPYSFRMFNNFIAFLLPMSLLLMNVRFAGKLKGRDILIFSLVGLNTSFIYTLLAELCHTVTGYTQGTLYLRGLWAGSFIINLTIIAISIYINKIVKSGERTK